MDAGQLSLDENWEEELLGALERGQGMDFIQGFLNAGGDINARINNRVFCWYPGDYDYIKPLIITNRRTVLFTAAMFGDSDFVKYLIRAGADVQARDVDDRSVLHQAVIFDNKDIVEILLENGVNIDICDGEGSTPLHYAAKYGHDKIVSYLIEKGAAFDVTNMYGSTPLLFAFAYRHKYIAESLISLGAEIYYSDEEGLPTLHLAIKHGNGWLDVVQYLIRRGCINVENCLEETALHAAAEFENVAAANLLLETGVDVNATSKEDETPLHLAAKNSNVDIARVLIERGAEVNCIDSKNRTPLYYAARKGRLDMVELLVENGADPDIRGKDFQMVFFESRLVLETPLVVAAMNGFKDIVCYLIKYTTNFEGYTNEMKGTVLHCAAGYGWLEVVELLVKRGANPNAEDPFGCTPLFCAAHSSLDQTEDIVQVLIDSGAHFDGRDKNNMTILHLAAKYGWRRVVEKLLNKNAMLDVKNSEPHGLTPLMIAAQQNHPNIMSLLIEAGADITISDEYKNTVLDYCLVNDGLVDVLPLLAKKGVDFNSRTLSGRIPLDLAAKNGQGEIVKFLIKSGVNLCNLRCDLLHSAAKYKWPEVVREILERGGDTNYVSSYVMNTALHSACEFNVVSIFVSITQDTILRAMGMNAAMISSFEDITKMLLERGLDINARNYRGETPADLAFVSLNRRVENDVLLKVLDFLFKAGADCNIEDFQHVSLFDLLASSGNIDLVRLGIENGGYFKEGFNISSIRHTGILGDVSCCTKAIVNKYNNKDLPAVYKLCNLAGTFPPIKMMKITPKSGIMKDVESAVIEDIESRSFCNVSQVTPISLSMLTVKSILSYFRENFR